MNKQTILGLSIVFALSGCWGDSSDSFGTTQQETTETPLPLTPLVTPDDDQRFIDTDLDGIADDLDNCPDSMSNINVDAHGCLASLRIQAENYLQAIDLTEGNTGGQYKVGDVDIYNAGDVDAGYAIRDNQVGEWQSYSITLPEGNYEIHSRVSSTIGEGGYSLYLNEQLIVADSASYATGDTTSWSTHRLGKFTLAGGDYTFKVVIDEAGLDLNWFDFIAVGDTVSCASGKPSEEQFECEITPLTAEQTLSTDDRIFYQMNYSTLGRDNALQKVTAQLDHIQSLNVNTLWLMPIHPRGATSTTSFNINYLSPDRHDSLSPYAVSDYLAISEELGDINDLRMLIDEAHKRGIAVILDWVANHTSWKNPWLVNKDWYTQVDNLVVSPIEQSWADVADLNYDNPQMRTAMIDTMLYWIKLGVDGFRCDYAAGVPNDFWQAVNQQIRQINPNAVLLAEGEIDDLSAGFDFTFSWTENINVQSAFETGDATQINAQQALATGKHLLRYSTNHDLTAQHETPIQIACTQIDSVLGECSAYSEAAQQGAIAQFVLHLFYGDVPMIYSGQEVGEAKNTSFYLDDLVDWTQNAETLSTYQALMAFYNSADVVKNGLELRYEHASVVAVQKTTDTERFVLLSNTLVTDNNYQVPAELQGDYVDALTGETVTLQASYPLSGFEYVLLTQAYTPPETGPTYGATQLYIRGDFNGWSASDTMTYIGDNTYIGTANVTATGVFYFKLAEADWGVEIGNAGAYQTNAPIDLVYAADVDPSAPTIQMDETGLYLFTLDTTNPDFPVITITKDITTYPGSTLYVRGFDGNWDASDITQMTYIGAGYYIYDIEALGDLNKGFKVANADWNAPNSGNATVTLGGEFSATEQADAGISLLGLTEEAPIRIIYHALDDTTHAGEVAVIINE